LTVLSIKRDAGRMATSKRPVLRKNDRVMLAAHKSVIPPYDGKPFVLRDTVLTVSHLTGTGSNKNPWHVVVTDGTYFWHLEPDDVVKEGTAHSSKRRTKKSRVQLDREIAEALANCGNCKGAGSVPVPTDEPGRFGKATHLVCTHCGGSGKK
jgi:hypothetical protein